MSPALQLSKELLGFYLAEKFSGAMESYFDANCRTVDMNTARKYLNVVRTDTGILQDRIATSVKYTLPSHVGFIPDGNRRWAVGHGLPKEAGDMRTASTPGCCSTISVEIMESRKCPFMALRRTTRSGLRFNNRPLVAPA